MTAAGALSVSKSGNFSTLFPEPVSRRPVVRRFRMVPISTASETFAGPVTGIPGATPPPTV